MFHVKHPGGPAADRRGSDAGREPWRALLGEVCERHLLPASAAARLERLVDLVASDPLAPTTVHDPLPVVKDHLADSLVALELDHVRSARVIADLGAGAGFPGLPLAIALPDSEVALVESNGRKCQFLESAVAACAARNAVVVHARVEAWEDGIGRCDLVVARALAPLPVVAEYAAPLLAPGGALVAWRGRRDPDDEAAATRAAAELGLEVLAPRRVNPTADYTDERGSENDLGF